MRYLLIAICAATLLSTSALADPWNGVIGKGHRGYDGCCYLAYNYGGRYNATYYRPGYTPAYIGPRYRLVFHERCSFTNDPSC
jgi:hypothetical protein